MFRKIHKKERTFDIIITIDQYSKEFFHMLSIPQNIQIEAKKIIENVFLEKCRVLLSQTMDNLFHSFSSAKYIESTLNLIRDIKDIILNTIVYVIDTIDKLFLNSSYRKEHFYVNKQNVSRTIVTVWGTLSFKRTYYTNKSKEDGFFLIDELFDFEKYKTYDQVIRGLLINESANTNTNKACNNSLVYNIDILKNLTSSSLPDIPRQTVYNWIKNWSIPDVSYDPIDNDKTLYVMVDEKWIHEQIRKDNLNEDEKNKKHYIMSKCFVAFTGAKTKNGRTELLGKHTFITSSKTPWKDLMDKICEIYDFEKLETINLLSDAGSWITAGKSELKLYPNNNIVVNTCEFHVKQKINRMTRDKDLRKQFVNVIYEEKDKNKFILLADDLIKNKPDSRKEKLTEYKNYILKHWTGIINMKNCDIKSSMESHISHCVAEHFGSRPKGYSSKRIENYLKIQEAKENGINILDLYLKSSYKEDDFVYNEKEISFSLFDKSISYLPVCTSSNPISILLHNIAYN